jgi:HEAT repeat protein
MSRRLAALLFAILFLIIRSSVLRAADDPEVEGKPLSQWLEILQGDKDPRNRRIALLMLDEVGLKSRKVVPAAVRSLRDDESPMIKEVAAQLLGKLALEAADLSKRSNNADKDAVDDFKRAFDALHEAAHYDRVPKVRAAAATALGRLGSDAKSAVPALIALLKDKDDTPRAAAAEALGRIGVEAQDAVPALLEVLKDRQADPQPRIRAAFALGRLGVGDAGQVVTALAETLAEPQAPADLRKTTADSLSLLCKGGRLGKEAAPAVSPLVQALRDKENVELRRSAAAALDQIGAEAKVALPDVKSALQDDDKFVRCQVLHLIGRFGAEGADALPDILRCSREDTVLEVRLAAIETLGALGLKTPEVEAELQTAANSSQIAIRDAARRSLKKLGIEP